MRPGWRLINCGIGSEDNLDIFWLRDESLEDTDNLADPDVIALDIVENLEATLEQFRLIIEDLGSDDTLIGVSWCSILHWL